jgi:PAS domain S-box-containing protein
MSIGDHEGTSRRPRILHLEDDQLDADLVAEFLRTAGLECDITRVWSREDYEVAIGSRSFDLILADYQLPSFDGVAALTIARQLGDDVPFIYVSGALGEELAVEAMRRGATDYVVKQRLDRLPVVVRRAIEEERERFRRRRAEAALQLTEERYRTIVETTPECVKLVAKDGAIMHMNDAGMRMVGAGSNADVVGRNVYDLIAPTDRERFKEFNERICAGERGTLEFDIISLDGVRRHMETQATPFRHDDGTFVQLSVTRDITDRVRADRKLRESEARFRELADNIPTLCWTADADGNIYWYNRRWYEYTGTTAEQVKGWGWQSVHAAEVLPDVLKHWKRSLETGEPFEMTFPLRAADGTLRPFLTRVEPIRDSAGTIVRWFGTNTDVSAQQKAEDALRTLNDTLEQRVVGAIAEREAANARLMDTQRLETLGQFTGGIAHDFNNLLTPIIGALDIVRQRLVGDERSVRLVQGALQAADRAKTLVQRLLAFSRRQVLDPQSVDVRCLVKDMLELLSRSAGDGIEIKIADTADKLPPARVDRTQLELALLNLVVNARDAMPDGGSITVDIRREAVGAGHPSGLRYGDYIRLAVIDTGVGMDDATLRRAIEPFYSTKGIGKGTGLGLSMVHGLAAQSGGTLLLSSDQGAGTRAEIWLPVASGPIDEQVVEPNGDGTAAKRAAPVKVLVVDDEALVRMATVDMLLDLGHEVMEASSGAAALDMLEHDGSTELVITDYLMPAMNGMQLAAEIKRRRPALPIVLATGYANLAGSEMADLPLIAKPFRQSEISALIAKLTGR